MRSTLRRLVDAKSGGLAVAQTAFANIAVQGLNVASGILTARTLAPAGRGMLAAVIMWPQFLAYAMSLGIPVATVYSIKRRPESTREIAEQLHISSKTVDVHRGHIREKMGLKDATGLVRHAVRWLETQGT